MSGWVKLHRVMLEHEIMTDSTLFHLFGWCLLKAGHSDRKLGGVKLLPGQFVTGRYEGSEQVGMKPSTWYSGMRRLESIGCIEMTANRSSTTVTICNWTTYQAADESAQHQPTPTNTDEHQTTPNNRSSAGRQHVVVTEEERKNLRIKELQEGGEGEEPKTQTPPTGGPKVRRKRRTVDYSPDFEVWWNAYPRREAKGDAANAYAGAVADLMVTGKFATSDDAAAFLLSRALAFSRSPAGKAGRFVPHPTTWLNKKRFDDDDAAWELAGNRDKPGLLGGWEEFLSKGQDVNQGGIRDVDAVAGNLYGQAARR